LSDSVQQYYEVSNLLSWDISDQIDTGSVSYTAFLIEKTSKLLDTFIDLHYSRGSYDFELAFYGIERPTSDDYFYGIQNSTSDDEFANNLLPETFYGKGNGEYSGDWYAWNASLLKSTVRLYADEVSNPVSAVKYDVPPGGDLGLINWWALDIFNGQEQYQSNVTLAWNVGYSGNLNLGAFVRVLQTSIYSFLDMKYGSAEYDFEFAIYEIDSATFKINNEFELDVPVIYSAGYGDYAGVWTLWNATLINSTIQTNGDVVANFAANSTFGTNSDPIDGLKTRVTFDFSSAVVDSDSIQSYNLVSWDASTPLIESEVHSTVLSFPIRYSPGFFNTTQVLCCRFT